MGELRVDQLSYAYGGNPILKGVSFSADRGQYVYILGPNGVGKSTLFRCIMGHLKAASGSVVIADKKVEDYSVKELAKKVAYIPQSCNPSFNYSVLELVMMGRTAHLSAFSSPREKDYDLAYKVLEHLGLQDKAKCGICEISGGERQLAMIARALVQEADILIMDEPTSNLDYGNQIRIQSQMKKLASEGLLIIQSSHNPQHAMLFADQIVALCDGKVIDSGKADDIVSADLLFKLYGLRVNVKDKILIPIIS